MKKLALICLMFFGLSLSGCDLLEGIEDMDDVNDLIDDINDYIPLDGIDDALKLASGGEIEGTFSSGQVLNYYFYLPLDIDVVLNLNADFEVDVIVRDYASKEVVFEMDETDFDADVYTLISLDTGEYEIELSGYEGDSVGNFTLSLELSNLMTPLNVETPASGDMVEDMTLFYKIDISQAGNYRFSVDAPFDMIGIFASSDGIYNLGESLPLDDLEMAFEEGTVYLKVIPYDVENLGSYEIHLSRVEDEAPEPTETTLHIGECILESITEGVKNHYSLEITETVDLDIYAYSNFDTDITILDAAGQTLISDSEVGDFELKSLSLEPGVYELIVSAYNNPLNDLFDLCIMESEDLQPNLGDLTLNTQVAGTIENRDPVIYPFTITSEGVFTAYLQSGLDTIGIIYDSAGEEVMRDDGFDPVTFSETPDFKIENAVLQAGDYELHIYGYSPADVGPYLLTTYFRENAGIDHEILPGQTVEWLIAPEGEIPYFFYLDQAGFVTLSLDSEFDSIGYLYDANDTFIYSDDELIAYNDDPLSGTGYDYVIEAVYLEPGFYRISTEGVMPGQYGDFALTLEVVYGDMAEATPIYKVSETEGILDQGDYDWYEIHLFNTGQLSAYLDSDFDSVGYLIDAYGRIIYQDDESMGLDFYLSWYLDPGYYYFVVTGFSPIESGEYTLITDFFQ